MRRLLLLLFTFSATFLLAQAPTSPPTNLRATSIDGNRTAIVWSRGDGSRRIVVVREATPVAGVPQDGIDYNPDGTFGEGDELNSGEFVVYDGGGSSFSLSGLAPSTTYHVAAFEYNGSGQGTEYLTTAATHSFTTLSAPTANVTNIQIADILGHTANVSWTNGDGSRRVVILRKGGPVDANPVDLTPYTGRANFPNGTEIGTGNFAVYASSGTSVSLTTLEPNTTYHGAIHEYNGSSGPVYILPGETFSFTTASAPSQAATNLVQAGLAEGVQLTMNYNNGNGSHRLIVASTNPISWTPQNDRLYTVDFDFGDGEEVSPGVFAIQSILSTATQTRSLQIRNLAPSTVYHFAIFEYNRSDDGSIVFYQSLPPEAATGQTAFAPAAAPTALQLTNNTGNSVRLDWTNSDARNYLVVAKEGSAVGFSPTDLIAYSTSSTFGSRDLGGGNMAIYRGSGSGVTITNLEAATDYHFAIFAYNGSATPVYLGTPARIDFTSLATPSASASGLTFQNIQGDRFSVLWTPGNGARQLVVARQGQAVSAEPMDGVNYTADDFGVGSELSPGEFAVFDGVYNRFNPPSIQGLQIDMTYHLAVFEYNEAPDGTRFYRRTDPGRGSQATVGIPTTASPSVSADLISSNSTRLTIAPGSGAARLVVMRANDPVNFTPQQLATYASSTSFGSRSLSPPDNYGITRLTTNSQVTVVSLQPNTTYHVAVFEYNGSNQPAYLLTPTTYSFTTGRYPTVNAQNLSASSIGATQLTLFWSNGNGASRIIVGRPTSAAPAPPADNSVYTANRSFGTGDATGPSNFVVYSAVSPRNVQVINLASGTEYEFTIYERADNTTETFYAVPGASIIVSTLAQPTVAPVNLQANNITPTTATIAWTTGNGTGEAILVSPNAPVDTLLQDGTYKLPRSNFPSGTPIGNAGSVFFGTTTTVNLTNLTPGTPYYVQAQAYNGTSQSPAYNQTGVTTMFRTPGPPSQQAVDANITFADALKISFDWTNGNGIGRIVLAKAGGPVDAAPVDGLNYSPNTFFGSGDEIGTGNFVVAFDDLDTLTVSNLMVGGIYHFAVFEYNGSVGNPLFNTIDPARTSVEAALPVEWLSFTGRVGEKGRPILEWKTAREENSAYFTVEHSTDGRQFQQLENVQAAGFSETIRTYTFTGASLPSGQHFFRIRQVDTDGAFSFSEMLVLKISTSTEIIAYPNPTQEVVYLNLPEPASFRVLDALGKTVKSGVVTRELSLAGLPKGPYYLLVGERQLSVVKQ